MPCWTVQKHGLTNIDTSVPCNIPASRRSVLKIIHEIATVNVVFHSPDRLYCLCTTIYSLKGLVFEDCDVRPELFLVPVQHNRNVVDHELVSIVAKVKIRLVYAETMVHTVYSLPYPDFLSDWNISKSSLKTPSLLELLSARCLKLCVCYGGELVSYEELHYKGNSFQLLIILTTENILATSEW